ncbi:hypothetical protein D3C84_1216140 [compost metagenome]
MNTIFFYDIPSDGGILTMYMEDLICPFTELRNRINQLDHLMTWLPFEPNIISRHSIEHLLPS